MTAYTSSGSGNWNDAATWGGVGYPSSSADTAAITGQHTVTIPSGVSIECGAITFGTGNSTNNTKLVINGTLDLAGTVTLGAYGNLYVGAGGTLDLNGQTVTRNAAPAYYNFIGTSGSRATIISTGTRGVFGVYAGNLNTTAQYADFSGLGDSEIGRGHTTSTAYQVYEYCTFTDCNHLALEGLCNQAGAQFRMIGCDFRNQNSVTPSTPDGYPYIYLSTTPSSSSVVRLVENCTWHQDSGEINPYFRWQGGTVKGCVFSKAKIYSLSSSAGYATDFVGCLLYTSGTSSQFFPESSGENEWKNMLGCFIHYDGNYHPFGLQAFADTDPLAMYGCVYENPGNFAGYGTNLFLGTTSPTIVRAKSNVLIGQGTLVTATGAMSATIHDIRHNTLYIDNDAQGDNYPAIYLTEQTGEVSGTVNIVDNVLVDPDSTTTPDIATYLRTNTAGQFDVCDYNLGYAYTAGAQSPPLYYKDVDGQMTELGTNDVSIDPQFVDKDRTLASWDASLGGAGTAAAAVTRCLADSTLVANAVRYIFDGFRPTNASVRSVSSLGATPGAAVFYDSSKTKADVTSARSYLGTTFGVSV